MIPGKLACSLSVLPELTDVDVLKMTMLRRCLQYVKAQFIHRVVFTKKSRHRFTVSVQIVLLSSSCCSIQNQRIDYSYTRPMTSHAYAHNDRPTPVFHISLLVSLRIKVEAKDTTQRLI